MLAERSEKSVVMERIADRRGGRPGHVARVRERLIVHIDDDGALRFQPVAGRSAARGDAAQLVQAAFDEALGVSVGRRAVAQRRLE